MEPKMTKVNISAFQRKMLRSAKLKHLSVFELINLNFVGKSDGRAGLPRKTQSGSWDAPRIRKEVNAYSEFCDRIWGRTQLDLKEDYAVVGALISEINRKEELLERLYLEPPAQPNESFFKQRMYGEESLTDAQVYARRKRELSKQNSPYYEKINTLEQEIRSAYIQLDERHNHIVETNNGTRLICERLKDHTEQRRSAYWNAALRTHPDKDSMPVVPEELPETEAELIYIAQHKTLEDEAVAMLARKERLISWNTPGTQANTSNVRKAEVE